MKVIPFNSDKPNEKIPREIHRLHFPTLDEAVVKLQTLPADNFNAAAVRANRLEGLVQTAAIIQNNAPAIQLLHFFTPTDTSLKKFEQAPGPVLYFLKAGIHKDFSPAMREAIHRHYPSLQQENYIPANPGDKTLSNIPGTNLPAINAPTPTAGLLSMHGYHYLHEKATRVYGDLVPPGESMGVTIKELAPYNDFRKAIASLIKADLTTVDPQLMHNYNKDSYQLSSGIKIPGEERPIARLVNMRYDGIHKEMPSAGLYLEFSSALHRRMSETAMPELKILAMPPGALTIAVATYDFDSIMRVTPTNGLNSLRHAVNGTPLPQNTLKHTRTLALPPAKTGLTK